MKQKLYNFIIAQALDVDGNKFLSTYTSKNREVQFGTKEEAYDVAQLVSKIKGKPYKAYFIELGM